MASLTALNKLYPESELTETEVWLRNAIPGYWLMEWHFRTDKCKSMTNNNLYRNKRTILSFYFCRLFGH
jgi:hypothetical protein